MHYRGDQELYRALDDLGITFEYYEHPAVPTVQEASKYWKDIESGHCKNLFFRNHKGNRHYLVIFEYSGILNIKDLEHRLQQGKLSFASPKRMKKYLGVEPGSVSPLGLIHDTHNHVHLFLDEKLKQFDKISFHPNLNTASLVISFRDLEKFLQWTGNTYEFIALYE
jgi:Ala-tRNA(Pro) deacylase